MIKTRSELLPINTTHMDTTLVIKFSQEWSDNRLPHQEWSTDQDLQEETLFQSTRMLSMNNQTLLEELIFMTPKTSSTWDRISEPTNKREDTTKECKTSLLTRPRHPSLTWSTKQRTKSSLKWTISKKSTPLRSRLTSRTWKSTHSCHTLTTVNTQHIMAHQDMISSSTDQSSVEQHLQLEPTESHHQESLGKLSTSQRASSTPLMTTLWTLLETEETPPFYDHFEHKIIESAKCSHSKFKCK